MKHIFTCLLVFFLSGFLKADERLGANILEELKQRPLTVYDRGMSQLGGWWVSQAEIIRIHLRQEGLLSDKPWSYQDWRPHQSDDRIYAVLSIPDSQLTDVNITKAACHNLLEQAEYIILSTRLRENPYQTHDGSHVIVISHLFTGVNATFEYVEPIEDMLWIKILIHGTKRTLTCQSSLYSDDVEYNEVNKE
jgi:hypothetical protein